MALRRPRRRRDRRHGHGAAPARARSRCAHASSTRACSRSWAWPVVSPTSPRAGVPRRHDARAVPWQIVRRDRHPDAGRRPRPVRRQPRAAWPSWSGWPPGRRCAPRSAGSSAPPGPPTSATASSPSSWSCSGGRRAWAAASVVPRPPAPARGPVGLPPVRRGDQGRTSGPSTCSWPPSRPRPRTWSGHSTRVAELSASMAEHLGLREPGRRRRAGRRHAPRPRPDHAADGARPQHRGGRWRRPRAATRRAGCALLRGLSFLSGCARRHRPPPRRGRGPRPSPRDELGVPALIVGLADEYDLLTEVGTPDGAVVTSDEALALLRGTPGGPRGPHAMPWSTRWPGARGRCRHDVRLPPGPPLRAWAVLAARAPVVLVAGLYAGGGAAPGPARQSTGSRSLVFVGRHRRRRALPAADAERARGRAAGLRLGPRPSPSSAGSTASPPSTSPPGSSCWSSPRACSCAAVVRRCARRRRGARPGGRPPGRGGAWPPGWPAGSRRAGSRCGTSSSTPTVPPWLVALGMVAVAGIGIARRDRAVLGGAVGAPAHARGSPRCVTSSARSAPLTFAVVASGPMVALMAPSLGLALAPGGAVPARDHLRRRRPLRAEPGDLPADHRHPVAPHRARRVHPGGPRRAGRRPQRADRPACSASPTASCATWSTPRCCTTSGRSRSSSRSPGAPPCSPRRATSATSPTRGRASSGTPRGWTRWPTTSRRRPRPTGRCASSARRCRWRAGSSRWPTPSTTSRAAATTRRRSGRPTSASTSVWATSTTPRWSRRWPWRRGHDGGPGRGARAGRALASGAPPHPRRGPVDRLTPVIFTDAWGSNVSIASLQGRDIPSPEPGVRAVDGRPRGGPGRHRPRRRARPRRGRGGRPGAASWARSAWRGSAPRLPFLLKVLAPGRAISIQAHPSAEQASDRAGHHR